MLYYLYLLLGHFKSNRNKHKYFQREKKKLMSVGMLAFSTPSMAMSTSCHAADKNESCLKFPKGQNFDNASAVVKGTSE